MPYVRRTKRRPSMTRKLAVVIGVCLVLALGLGVAGMIVAYQDRLARGAAEAASYTPAPLATAEDDEPIRTAFIGDSYNEWHEALPGDLSLSPIPFGQGGTGYANGAETGTNYAARIDDVVAANPSVVVVSGGRNDRNFAPEQIDSGTEALFQGIRAGLPDATIIAVNPWWDASEPHPALPLIGDSIRTAVESVGGTYIDSGQPLQGKPELIGGDAIHPNEEGYDALATAVADELEATLPR